MRRMNRETMIDPADRVIVLDRGRSRRTWIIAAIVGAFIILFLYRMIMRRRR